MSAPDASKPHVAEFATLRAEAVANLEAIRTKRAFHLRSAEELAVIEDRQLTSLAKMEQFARGDFSLAGVAN